MSDSYNVEILIDGDVLENLLLNGEEQKFLLYWIYSNKTKAVVPKKSWKGFYKQRKKNCGDNKEVFDSIIASFRGIVTPYRTKYVDETGAVIPDDEENPDADDKDDFTMITTIINRHYATVKYVIVKDPAPYRTQEPKIKPERITTLEGFYKINAVENYESFKKFQEVLE